MVDLSQESKFLDAILLVSAFIALRVGAYVALVVRSDSSDCHSPQLIDLCSRSANGVRNDWLMPLQNPSFKISLR